MESNFLTNFYNLTSTELSSALVVLNLLLSFGLATLVVWVWRKTHTGLSYSQSFAITIVMIAPLASAVMMIVQNNLIGAFALLGAFSLIRFRTIMKETRDIAFLFFALTIGVSVGTGYYALALITTALLSSIILLLYRYSFASSSKNGYLITFHAERTFDTSTLDPLFTAMLASSELIHEKISNAGIEYAYTVIFKEKKTEDQFLKKLSGTQGIADIFLLSGKDTIEY